MPGSKRWLIVATVLLALLLLVLVGTPYLIERLAEQWLDENGGDRVEVRDVDFNPFTAELVFEGVEIEVEDRKPLNFERAYLQLGWLPLWDKRIDVQHVELEGFSMLVRNKDVLRVGGILIQAGEDEAEPEDSEPAAWLAGLKSLTLNDFTVFYEDKKISSKVYIDTLTLAELRQWTPESPARLEYRGAINDASVELQAMLSPFASAAVYEGTLHIEKLPLNGFEALTRPALEELGGLVSLDADFNVTRTNGKLHIHKKGRLALQNIDVKQQAAHISNRNTEWNGTADLVIGTPEAPTTLKLDGKLGLQATEVTHQAAHISNQSSEWNGTTDLVIGTPETPTSLTLAGSLAIGELDTHLPQQQFRITWNALDLQGSLTLPDTALATALGMNADIALSGLDLSVPDKAVNVISTQKIELTGLEVEGTQQIRIGKVVAESLDLGRDISEQNTAIEKERQAIYHAGKVVLEQISHNDGFTSIDTIQEDDVHVIYHRDKQGVWKVNSLLATLSADDNGQATGKVDNVESTSAAAAEQSGDQARIAVNRVDASKGSSLTILDEAVTPTFREVLTVNELWLTDLDSRKPDQASTLKLDGMIGKYSKLTASGKIKPFLQPPGVDLTAKLYAMDLPKLSAYTRDSMGLLLDSGTLNVDLNVTSSNKVLEGGAVLELQQLSVQSTGSKDGLASKLPVSLDLALDTLRDRNNTIKLKIPIKGDADQPEFDISDAINQATAKAVILGASTYLKYVLQPYGALLTVAQYAGEAATKVRLDPIKFEPGGADMDDTDRDYLSKVAQILKERPQLAIKLCGVATEQDLLYYQQQEIRDKKEKADKNGSAKEIVVDSKKLNALAEQRAAAVKDYLVGHFNAPANRIVGCQPRIETDATKDTDQTPRTDILI